jgi:hypothetical protein
MASVSQNLFGAKEERWTSIDYIIFQMYSRTWIVGVWEQGSKQTMQIEEKERNRRPEKVI